MSLNWSSPLPLLLLSRQTGATSSAAFSAILERRRCANMRASPLRDVDAGRHSAPLRDLDPDPTEDGRFLLAGAADGTVYVHDLERPPRSREGPKFTAAVAAHVGRSSKHSHKVNCVR